VNTSGKKVKEYNSIAPVIPQFIAENNSIDQNQLNAIKSDLIRTSANAKSDLNILQPSRKREGTLQEDIGFTKISSMANAQDPKFGRIDKDFVSDELEDQAPLGAYGDIVEYNTLRGEMASRHKEDMSFAGKGVRAELAQILDPNVSNQLFLASEFRNVPQSPLFAKPDPKPARPGARQQPTNLFSTQQNAQAPTAPPNTGGGGDVDLGEIDEFPPAGSGEGIFGRAAPPRTRPSKPAQEPAGSSSNPLARKREALDRAMAKRPQTEQAGSSSGKLAYDPTIDKFEYKSGEVFRGEREPATFTGSYNSKSALVTFLSKELLMEGKSAVSKKEYLQSISLNDLRSILYDFFPIK